MNPKLHCPECGGPIRDDDPMGLCASCLLVAGSVGILEEKEGETGRPRRFGDYILEEEIARGGMGVVYRAKQISLGRTVALKMILYPGLAGSGRLKRLKTEATTAAALRHPNVVSLYEVGEVSGQAFLTMEFVAGPDLARLTREGPLAPKVAAR